MGRYTFSLVNDGGFMPDLDGVEMPDFEAVRGHATQAIADIIADELRQGKTDVRLSLLVDGEDGERVASFQAIARLEVDENPLARPAPPATES